MPEHQPISYPSDMDGVESKTSENSPATTGEKKTRQPMTSASPSTSRETVEFTTAREFFNHQPPADPDRDYPPAKTITWYDPQTPIFCCGGCAEAVEESLAGQGDGDRDGHEQVRQDALDQMWSDEGVPCDGCSGRLVEKLDA